MACKRSRTQSRNAHIHINQIKPNKIYISSWLTLSQFLSPRMPSAPYPFCKGTATEALDIVRKELARFRQILIEHSKGGPDCDLWEESGRSHIYVRTVATVKKRTSKEKCKKLSAADRLCPSYVREQSYIMAKLYHDRYNGAYA